MLQPRYAHALVAHVGCLYALGGQAHKAIHRCVAACVVCGRTVRCRQHTAQGWVLKCVGVLVGSVHAPNTSRLAIMRSSAQPHACLFRLPATRT